MLFWRILYDNNWLQYDCFSEKKALFFTCLYFRNLKRWEKMWDKNFVFVFIAAVTLGLPVSKRAHAVLALDVARHENVSTSANIASRDNLHFLFVLLLQNVCDIYIIRIKYICVYVRLKTRDFILIFGLCIETFLLK